MAALRSFERNNECKYKLGMGDLVRSARPRPYLFMAGIYKVFQQGPVEHARQWFLPYSDTFLPVWSLWAMGVTIPFVEMIGGGLVILGFRTSDALIALGCVLAVVTFGHLLKEPLYEFHTHVIPRLALLLFILVLPREADRFSMDHFLGGRIKTQNTELDPEVVH